MMQWSSVPLLKRIFGIGNPGAHSTKFHGVVERFLSSLKLLLRTLNTANV